MSIYLDTSVLIPTLVDEPTSAAVRAYLIAADEALLISDLAAVEVASGLSRLVRMGVAEFDHAENREEGAEDQAKLDEFKHGLEALCQQQQAHNPELKQYGCARNVVF